MTAPSRSLLWRIAVPVFAVQVLAALAVTLLVWPRVPDALRNSTALLIWVLGLASAAVMAAFIMMAGRSIRRQANAIARTAEQFSRGDFTQHVPQPSVSELETMGRALDDMAGELNTRIADLRLQQRQQRAILQSMSNAVLAVDTEQRISMVNRAAEDLLGLRADAVHGRLLQEVIRQPELHGFVRRALSDPAPQQTEMRLHGEPAITVQATSGPLTTVDGAPAGLLMVLNDVTELRRLESLRSEFAANVSHELRTPITNLKGYVETLLEVGTSDPEQTGRFLEIIRHNIDRLAAIVDDVMALTEFERPRFRERIERTSTPVESIIDNVIEQFGPGADAKGITLESQIPPELSVFVQPRLIEQAVGNLVSNAITYSPTGTTVTIAAAAVDSGQVEIAVIDEGPGIAREHLSRLFERFYRVDQARSREVGGTGLGLAIVKHIALSNGGRVDVESQLGRGSRFVIILPAG